MLRNWNIPKLWEGETVFILGGGASIISQFGIPSDLVKQVRAGKLPMSIYSNYFEALHDKHVIGVNAVFQLGDWLDAIYFIDKDFMLTWRNKLSKYPNPVYSPLPYTEGESWCHTLKGTSKFGICEKPHTVGFNHNSGAGAINLAYHMGAAKIVLIGFDMKTIARKQHFHGAYINSELPRTAETKMEYSKHLQVFPQIKKDADRLGVEIINTSLKSALDMFEKMPLEEVLL